MTNKYIDFIIENGIKIPTSTKEVSVGSSAAQTVKTVLNRAGAHAILTDGELRNAETAAVQLLRQLLNEAISQHEILVDDSTGLSLFEWRKSKERSATITPIRVQGGMLKLVVSTYRHVDREGGRQFKLKLKVEMLWLEGSWFSTEAFGKLKLASGGQEAALERTSPGSFEAEIAIALSKGRAFSVM